jgi:DNA topoisomerase-1
VDVVAIALPILDLGEVRHSFFNIMSKRLLIVESPGKLKKLSQILGADWIVKASWGHIRELSDEGEDSLGFVMEESRVKCNYIPRNQRAQETIQQLKAATKQVSEVILATDPDREGETIAWHLKEVLGLKEPKRVIYTEITASAVRDALAHPRQLDYNLIGAGLCRDCLDKLVGYKGSPLVWSFGAKSVGRVQSATLHLICQREREIQAFVPQDYWSVWVDYAEGFRAFYKGTVNSPGETPETEAEVNDDAGSPTKEPESKRVLSEAEAKRLVEEGRSHPHDITEVQGKVVKRQPPPPFTTSTLQQAAGSKLRFTPDQTMLLAQKLYEAGLITYMRTDSVLLSPEFCNSARQWLEQNDPQNVPQQVTRHRSSQTAQEAHEAIRPTDVFRPSTELKVHLPADEFNLYVLIWKRAVASQCKPAQLRQTLIITRSGSLLWQAKGQVVEFWGYARYWNNLSQEKVLPLLQQGQTLTAQKVDSEKKQTQPPPRYSEPKLVQVMERKGIGRPSTYAPTIATLKKRDYVQLTKGSLQPTALGFEVDTFLQKALPDLLAAEFTARMEDALDAIAQGKQGWQQYLTGWNQSYFTPALAKAKDVVPSKSVQQTTRTFESSKTRCPQCNNFLVKVPSTKVKKKYFLKCNSGCENVVLFWSDYSKTWEAPRTKVASVQKLSKYPCPVCKKPLEEYSYTKEGESRTMLRCSSSEARSDKKHKDVAFFHTQKGWWSPKFGELGLQ